MEHNLGAYLFFVISSLVIAWLVWFFTRGKAREGDAEAQLATDWFYCGYDDSAYGRPMRHPENPAYVDGYKFHRNDIL